MEFEEYWKMVIYMNDRIDELKNKYKLNPQEVVILRNQVATFMFMLEEFIKSKGL